MSEWLQHPDARLDAPAFHRNRAPLLRVLGEVLGGHRGDVVEIGCGSGQHTLAFARALPELAFWPTDPQAEHCASADAWRETDSLPNLHRARQLDARQASWLDPGATPLAAVLSINVLHIAPFDVTEALFAGAARHLANDGRLCIYGPFARDGEHTAPSNAAFDASLRARDPAWGIRDLAELDRCAAACRLMRVRTEPMPANNLTLVFAPI